MFFWEEMMNWGNIAHWLISVETFSIMYCLAWVSTMAFFVVDIRGIRNCTNFVAIRRHILQCTCTCMTHRLTHATYTYYSRLNQQYRVITTNVATNNNTSPPCTSASLLYNYGIQGRGGEGREGERERQTDRERDTDITNCMFTHMY